MPFIAFESGQLTPAIRQRLIAELTRVSAEILGIPESYFLVALREWPNENVALGGKNVDALRAELAARQGGGA